MSDIELTRVRRLQLASWIRQELEPKYRGLKLTDKTVTRFEYEANQLIRESRLYSAYRLRCVASMDPATRTLLIDMVPSRD